MSQSILLSTAYLPSVFYLKKMLESDIVVFEKHENFIKQTYRNRCTILTANGLLTLSIQLIKQSNKESISEKRIAYTENWQKQHWRTLTSAYKNSPYFDFFEHEFKPFYENKYEFLIDYNSEIIKTILKILRINKEINFTNEFSAALQNTTDFRLLSDLNPKIDIESTPYYQVFSDKIGFQKNISCIDALFNIGLDVIKL